jgi:hypothetical protein
LNGIVTGVWIALGAETMASTTAMVAEGTTTELTDWATGLTTLTIWSTRGVALEAATEGVKIEVTGPEIVGTGTAGEVNWLRIIVSADGA